jgi:hypothetical protein
MNTQKNTMKHLIALMLILLSLPACAKDDDERTPWDIFVIPHAGVSYSHMTGNSGDWKLGVAGGAALEVYLLQNLSMNVDVYYSHQGDKNTYHTIDDTTTGPFDYRFDYLNVDYLLKWYPVKHFNLCAGVMGGRLVNAKSEVKGHSTDISDDLHSGTVAIPVGAGYEYKNWTLDARFYYPINALPDSKKAKNILGSSAHEMSVMVTLGYRIQLF